MFRAITLSTLVIVLSACTTAGPYVTNISSDGNNGLNIEKCQIKADAYMGTISTTGCTSSHINLGSTPSQKLSRCRNYFSID